MGSIDRKREDIPFEDFFTAQKLVAEIQAGEMLYLPAGWFHEVHSFGADVGNDGVWLCSWCFFVLFYIRFPPSKYALYPAPAHPGEAKASVHMAVNYWFHPADTHDFNHPYADATWERMWAMHGLPPPLPSLSEGEGPVVKRARV